jgi:hypothetical protein
VTYTVIEQKKVEIAEGKYAYKIQRERARDIANSLGLNDFAEFVKIGCYEGLFNSLSEMCKTTPDKALALMGGFYGKFGDEKEEYFPNGTELGRFMHRTMNIDWFNPKRDYSSEELQDDVDRICRRFGIGNLEARMEGDFNNAFKLLDKKKFGRMCSTVINTFGNHAEDMTAIDLAVAMTHVANFINIWHASSGSLGEEHNYLTVKDASELTCYMSEWGAAYFAAGNSQVLKSAYPENPFESLIDVYEKGLYPVGPSEHGRNFLIWHPEVKAVR